MLNDTDMCKITAACLSFNLYHSLVTCAPAFRKPRYSTAGAFCTEKVPRSDFRTVLILEVDKRRKGPQSPSDKRQEGSAAIGPKLNDHTVKKTGWRGDFIIANELSN
jgi:hypothetical protein